MAGAADERHQQIERLRRQRDCLFVAQESVLRWSSRYGPNAYTWREGEVGSYMFGPDAVERRGYQTERRRMHLCSRVRSGEGISNFS